MWYRYSGKACQDGVSGPHCVLSLFDRARLAQSSCVLSHPPRPYHMRMRGVKWGRMGYCMGVRCDMLTIRYKRNLSPKHSRFRYCTLDAPKRSRTVTEAGWRMG